MADFERELSELADKYRQLLRMRREREVLEAEGILCFEGEALERRRAESRELAKRFPGALRELDVFDARAIARRLAEVEAEIASGAERAEGTAVKQDWIPLMIDYHALWREALAIKRWLTRRSDYRAPIEQATLARFLDWFERAPARRTPLGAVDAAWLARYQSPPSGRLMNVIWGELIARHGGPRERLAALLFEPPEE